MLPGYAAGPLAAAAVDATGGVLDACECLDDLLLSVDASFLVCRLSYSLPTGAISLTLAAVGVALP